MNNLHPDDLTRLQHMLDAAREVETFTSTESRTSLDTDRKLVLALMMAIGIIGEAASKISDDLQRVTPYIPWAKIVGMRNRIIHAYFDIDLDILWDTATEAVPPLIVELEKLLSPSSE